MKFESRSNTKTEKQPGSNTKRHGSGWGRGREDTSIIGEDVGIIGEDAMAECSGGRGGTAAEGGVIIADGGVARRAAWRRRAAWLRHVLLPGAVRTHRRKGRSPSIGHRGGAARRRLLRG
jgi:hypothetical protein